MSTLTKSAEHTKTGTATPERYHTPPASVRETPEGYVLEVEMPGVSKDGIEVLVENNELTVLGRRSDRSMTGEVVFQESNMLDHKRVFELDPAIDTARISAKMDQGMLTLTLPKAEHVKPRKIRITN